MVASCHASQPRYVQYKIGLPTRSLLGAVRMRHESCRIEYSFEMVWLKLRGAHSVTDMSNLIAKRPLGTFGLSGRWVKAFRIPATLYNVQPLNSNCLTRLRKAISMATQRRQSDSQLRQDAFRSLGRKGEVDPDTLVPEQGLVIGALRTLSGQAPSKSDPGPWQFGHAIRC